MRADRQDRPVAAGSAGPLLPVLGPLRYLCVRAGRTLAACATYRTCARDTGIQARKGKPKSEAPDRSEAPRSSPWYIRPVRRGGDIGTARGAVKSSLNWAGPRRTAWALPQARLCSLNRPCFSSVLISPRISLTSHFGFAIDSSTENIRSLRLGRFH